MAKKRTKTDIDTLIAELKLDVSQLDELERLNRQAEERILHGATELLDYAALGYTIHNMYGLMENAFLRVSRFFENNLSSRGWHMDLLRKMLIEIPHVRKAFLDYDSFLLFDEIRSFRHVFRNLYNRTLRPEKVEQVQKKIPEALDAFKKAVQQYIDFLEKLRDALDV